MPAFGIRQYVYEGLPRDQLDEHLAEIFASAYSMSLFTDWRGPGIRQVWLKRLADEPGLPGMPADRLPAHSTPAHSTPAHSTPAHAAPAHDPPASVPPRWGKLFSVSPAVLRGLYERLPDFQRLRGDYDPAGKFGNDLVDAYVPAGP